MTHSKLILPPQVSPQAEDQEGEGDRGDGAADSEQPGQRGPLTRHPGQAQGGDEEPERVPAEHCPHWKICPP